MKSCDKETFGKIMMYKSMADEDCDCCDVTFEKGKSFEQVVEEILKWKKENPSECVRDYLNQVVTHKVPFFKYKNEMGITFDISQREFVRGVLKAYHKCKK